MPDYDERAAIEAAQKGDQAAFESIFHRYERQIYSFTYRMMGGDADDAADMTQNTFIKAYAALGRTDDKLNVSAWLHRIANNACLDVLRRRQRLRWLAWDGPAHDQLLTAPPPDDPEWSAVSEEARTVVQRVLDGMSERNRQALVLREYEGLSCEQIGQIMGASRLAVKSMLFRAREEFRRVYMATNPTDDIDQQRRTRRMQLRKVG